MSASNLYSPSITTLNRREPPVTAADRSPLVLPLSARLRATDRCRATNQSQPKAELDPRNPGGRKCEFQRDPLESDEAQRTDLRGSVEARTEEAQTGPGTTESFEKNLLPVRYSPSGCLILVARARGGVGATSLAVNLALEMSGERASRNSIERKKVVFVDFDVQFGTGASCLDVIDRGGLLKLLQMSRHPDIQAVRSALVPHKSGLRVLAAPGTPIPLEALDRHRVAAITDALMADNDVVIVDMPPALVSWIEPLLSRAERLLMVTNLAVTSLSSARRMIDILREDAPNLTVEAVVSREQKPFVRRRFLTQAAEALGAPLSYWLPEETRKARLALDRGEPLIASAPRSPWSRALRKIAQTLHQPLPRAQIRG